MRKCRVESEVCVPRLTEFLQLFRFRRLRTVICPETGRAEEVHVDAPHAAWTEITAFNHHASLRLSSCSAWPERQYCAETCLRQIEARRSGAFIRCC